MPVLAFYTALKNHVNHIHKIEILLFLYNRYGWFRHFKGFPGIIIKIKTTARLKADLKVMIQLCDSHPTVANTTLSHGEKINK